MRRWPIVSIALEREGDVVFARQRARRIAALIDFDLQDQTRIATAVSEIARNAQSYGGGGRVEFALEGRGTPELICIRITDRGPGFSDPQAALEGRLTSEIGLGLGVVGARRLMDGFELRNRPEGGAEVVMSKAMCRARPFPPDRLEGLSRQLALDVAGDPLDELRLQNQELLRSLEALESRRIEAVALSEELERTNKGVVALYAELDQKAQELQELNATLEQRVASALAEQALTEERLRQSQKMEAVGQLTGGIAHDFNNLLMVIGGSLELLRRRVPADPAITRLVDAASQGVARGGLLNQQLLAFARRQDLREEVVCLNDRADGFVQLVERAVREDVAIRMELAEGLWHCRTDPHQLETAVLNLSINARDAMPSGGVLTLKTENRVVDAEVAALWEAVAGEYVAVSVADTGTGMAPEIIDHVFEPFFTTKEVGRGTGLGLSQVYGFAKQSGGFVTIDSVLGEGARVTIHLRRAAPQPQAQTEKSDNTEHRTRSASILLIEDEPAVREMTSEMLRDLGHQVAEASGGLEGMTRLRRDRFDLVFSDVILPGGLSGVDVAREVAGLWPETSVLLTSGYTAQRLDLARQTKLRVLMKPYSRETLALAIAEVLEERYR